MNEPGRQKATANEIPAKRVQRLKQRRLLNLFGQIDYDPKYDHKAGRRSR